MGYETILCTVTGAVAAVTLNRPDRAEPRDRPDPSHVIATERPT